MVRMAQIVPVAIDKKRTEPSGHLEASSKGDSMKTKLALVAALLAAAAVLRDTYGASRMAGFVEEAVEIYEQRGLFSYRF